MVGTAWGFDLVIYLVGAFAAAVVTGLAGFAFGLIAAAVWLHVLTPLQTTTLIVVFALLVQGLSVWRLRHAVRISRLWPFLLGGVLGVPFGAELLRWGSPGQLRSAIGILLVLFAGYSLLRPKRPTVTPAGPAADGGIGFVSGVLGAATGLGGILPTIWCSLRGWSRDEQRAVFQPVAVGIFVATLVWLGGAGEVGRDTLRLIDLGVPVVALGTWLGLRLYGRLDEAGFRKIVLWLLLLSGAALILR